MFNGALSAKLAHWNYSADCCSWEGVTCSEGRVIGLDLSNESISGVLDNSNSLFNLPRLQKLNLAYNEFDSSQVLRMSRCYLSRPFDPSLQNLQSLSVIHLAHNYLTSLSFTSCNLNGKFPKKIFQIPTLQRLELSGNTILQGSLGWIWKLPNLAHLNLSFNYLLSLEGPFLSCPTLNMLDLRSNHFHGQFPFFLPSVVYLDLSKNNFNSSIQKSIENLPNTTNFFSLSSNKFNGIIPVSICNATYLQVLGLSNGSFNGIIPRCLIEMTLNENQLGGELPKSLANCTKLKVLPIGNNHIEDTFPWPNANAALPIPKEIVIDVSYNNLEGTIPEEIGQINSLRVLNLSHNALIGQIPPYLEKLSRLISLDLSSNKLTGKILENLIELTLLSTLNLSFNHLVGQIPRMRFHETSYEGNEGLCGFPLHEECKDSESFE
ncbi:hypothetical protein I3843_09G208400 [Carya illinoinensis]|nr:hypothetical protein I3843_09G208400 [Carya illinoinensis]